MMQFHRLAIGSGIAFGLASSLLSVLRPKELGPGAIYAKRDVVVWRSPTPGANQVGVEATFELTNEGDSPVRILSVESGCGCAKPKVEPQVIAAGRTATVVIEAIPFPVGERVVAIRLNTDSPKTPTVRLSLKMIGSRKPPFLLNVDGDLHYLNQGATRLAREFRIHTVEAPEKGEVPKPSCGTDAVEFELTSISEKPYTTPDTVVRTYTYRANFRGAVEKTISDEIRVVDPWDAGRAETLRIDVKVAPPIRVVPSPIVLPSGGRDAQATAEFLVLTEDAADDVVVEPESSADASLSIERINRGGSGRVASFRVGFAGDSGASTGDHRLIVRRSSRPRSEAQVVTVLVRGKP